MGIRIQPRDIEVPEDNPFQHDLLDRQEAVDTLTHLIGNLEGPCVLAIDAGWGAGKTTFLKIWAQRLRNEGFPVVEFNAWKTDFSKDPFVTLSSELTEGLRECGGEPLGERTKAFRKAATEVLRCAMPGLIRFGTAGILDINPLLEEEAGNALASYARERLSEYEEARNSVHVFGRALQDAANTLSEEREGRPLILMIDELDRCRPSYAVELLEVAKHLFSVDHIVFVLAVNRDQLAHSVKALYGRDFDAERYLRRFFDLDFRLPDPSRDAFITAQLEVTQIAHYFAETNNPSPVFPLYRDIVPEMLLGFFQTPDLSLRTIAQAIHRLGLLFASLPRDQLAFATATTVALILRTIDPGLYHRFTRGEATDLEVVEAVFKRPGMTATRYEHAGRIFESTIILAANEEVAFQLPNGGEICSPLFQQYKQLVDAEGAGDIADSSEREHANAVIDMAEDTRKSSFRGKTEFGFKQSVQRLELLSATLIDR